MPKVSGEGGRFGYAVLGPLEVWFEGERVPVTEPRHRALLTALLVWPNKQVPSARLAGLLWEEPPARATNLLHGRVAEVRRLLREAAGAEATDLVTQDGGYLLRVAADALDVTRFERLVEMGLRAAADGKHRTAARLQREALALWRGPALADLVDRPGAMPEITRLNELRLRSLAARIDADLAEGGHQELIAELAGLVTEHPLLERFWEQLMLARYRAGQVGDAVSTFDTVRRELVERLGTEPGPRLRRLHQQMLREDPALNPAPPVRPLTGAPPLPLTSFVGRDRELAEVRRLLRTQRLVTVTGVGGVGKSRLAAEVGARAGEEHPGGVWFVELAGLTRPDLLADTVGDVLDAPSHVTHPRVKLIKEQLRDADALLILDNCEHLLDAAAEFAVALLSACPRLRILTTTRERLGVTGETLLPLPGLSVPGPGDTTPESAARAAAVRLFVERAIAVDADFALTDATVAAITKNCQELDGLPLAIELAAARVNALAVDEIASRLDDRFGLLRDGNRTADPRHRTLQAVVDWSFHLLEADERRVFTRLSIFAGRFELGWAEQLGADLFPPGKLARIVAALVDKSLLTQQSGRYRMLETLRVYGHEQLAGPGELEHARDRHAELVAGAADRVREEFDGDSRGDWARLRDSLTDEFRAALEWAATRGDAVTAMRIAGVSTTYSTSRGPYAVGRRLLRLALNAAGVVPPVVRARALSGMALLASVQGDLPAAIEAGEAAAAIFERTEDRAGHSLVLRRLAMVETMRDNLDRAEELLLRSGDLARGTGSPWLRGWVLTQHGLVVSFRGDWEQAARMSAEAEALLRDGSDPEALGFATLLGAEAARNLTGPAAGAGRLRAAVGLFGNADLSWAMSMALYYAAGFLRDLGRPHEEVIMLAAGIEIRRITGEAFWLRLTRHQDARLARLREILGDEEFETHSKIGRTSAVAGLIDRLSDWLGPEIPAGPPDADLEASAGVAFQSPGAAR